MKRSNRLLAAMAALCLSAPVQAQAELTTVASVYLGYGNYGVDPNTRWLGVGLLSANGTWPGGEGVTLKFKSDLYLRTDNQYLSNIGDDWGDIDVGVQVDGFGTFGLSTYARCGATAVPWVTGRIEQRGGVGVHARLGNRFRCIGADNGLFADNRPQIFDTKAYLYYKGQFGRASIDAYWDPWRHYGPYRGDETNSLINMGRPGHGDEQPEFELNASYAFDRVIFGVGFNDQDHNYVRAIVPVPSQDLTLIAETTYQPIDDNARSSSIAVDWKPKDLGPFKSLLAIYLWDATDENLVLSARFGTDQWSMGIGADTDGDVGFEASYTINDKLDLLFGADNGYKTLDGFDYRHFPPPFVKGRKAAYEIGLRYTF